jgi:hypothetical protein
MMMMMMMMAVVKKKTVKENTERETNFLKTYKYITKSDKDCDLLQDRIILPSGKTPHDKQNRNCLNYSQNLAMSPEGLNAMTD